MTLKIVSCPSPNHDARPGGGAVDILVLHYTGMKTADEALARLCDPKAKVSAHYTIGRDGRVFAPMSRRSAAPGMPASLIGRARRTSMPAPSASSWSIPATNSATSRSRRPRSLP
ncbi:MAG: N-acetylmuramoyl-L-alanine amidase [Rhizomicrobium sp.]